ncbi:MAG TPA: WYL domain-containing protein [Candidatus Dormibacteraeota bacterium]|nr:WYL domain-containing protein [Candidatus Dormibacteraeota bacterium]
MKRRKAARARKGLVDTQPQLTRLHGLVQRIQKGDFPSQKVLAKEWEKNSRTIQRDLDFIRDIWKMPLQYDQYKYGYYFTEKIGKFPMVPISKRELVSVFVAQKALQQYRGTSFEQPLRSAFQKLSASLEGELSVAWSDLDAAISFRGIETDVGDVTRLQELGEAVRTRNEVQFDYSKLQSDETLGASRAKRPASPPNGAPGHPEPRRVRPYHLACVGGQWYLIAYDLLREDIRKFIPARMSNLRVLNKKFERPADFSVDKYLKGSFGIFSGSETVRMRIWFSRARAQIIRERKWHHSQKIKELGNGEVELSLELSSFVEIVPWILSWGEHARAVAPKGLVKEMASVIKGLDRAYRP